MEVTAGFLVVKTFERMCREYLATIERLRQTRNVPVLMWNNLRLLSSLGYNLN